jgi:23S rRNA (cytosine1962-C5)-methyltransferase
MPAFSPRSMSDFPRVILRQKAIEAVKRFHPWIFSGAIEQTPPNLTEGDFVDVHSKGGDYLATGLYNGGNIAIRIFSFEPVSSLEKLFLDKFQQAYSLRQQIGLVDNPMTNCYRLINAEGDGVPGLIVDYYNGTAVIQAHSLGIHRQRDIIVKSLRQVCGDKLKAVYDKSEAILPSLKQEMGARYLFGSRDDQEIMEYGHRFLVDWEEGQKTGFFLDQRENRLLLDKYVRDKKVLNTFCYSGGFSLYAMRAGAKEVHSVDSSSKAMQLMAENLILNGENEGIHRDFTADVFNFLKNSDSDYEVIILDPPAFAKGLSARHQAVMAYRRLNLQAFNKLKRGGILFTFSCSQVVTPEHFSGAVTAAAIDSGRNIRILHHLRQPADHPVNIYHPEGLYLKGLVLSVE